MKSYRELMKEFPAAVDHQVVIDNMQMAPFNRWAFPQMRRLLPTTNIWRGDGPMMLLERNLIDISEIEYTNVDGKICRVGELFGEDYTDGLVVLKNGEIVCEQYRDDLFAHEPHLLMSVSKSLAGSLCGILVEQGKLSPDDLVTDILPEVIGSAYDDAKVRHVLDMTVGMDFDENYENPLSDVGLLDMAAGWRTSQPGSSDGLRQFLATIRKSGPHGVAFYYASVNSDLLGWILERVAGKDMASLFSELIWQPMGAEFDGYITVDRYGAPQTDGGFCVTARDLARFGQLHLQMGMKDGQSIIPSKWIQDFQLNGDAEVWDRGNFASFSPQHHYRSKWYTDLSDTHKPYKGIGIHGQFLVVDPVAEIVIAHLASHPEPENAAYFRNLEIAFGAICHHFSKKKVMSKESE